MQKYDLLTYLKKGFYTKVSYVLNFKWEGEVLLYFLFSWALHLTIICFNLFANFVNMQDTSHQMKDYLRSYCFSSLDLCQKRNLKNIDLAWATLENNNKFDALHNFSHFQTNYGKIHIFLNVYILLYIMLTRSLCK